MWIKRAITSKILDTLQRGKNVLLFGPRQSGKTSLVKKIEHDLYLTLMNPQTLHRYETKPEDLIFYIKALYKELKRKPVVIIDEVQKIPTITDSLQVLIDDDIAQFIITGSSARKIKNLLPGRVIKYNLTSLSLTEIDPWQSDLNFLLMNGSLPEIHTSNEQCYINNLLKTYVNLYIEEEIRKEALVRNIGSFSNFVRLAAIESGNIINLSAIASDIGINHHTIAEYYNILKECMLVEVIEPIFKSNTRKRLTKSPKYILADLGIRRMAAEEPYTLNRQLLAKAFEQFIGLEIKRVIDQLQCLIRLKFWRSHDGPEVDYVLEFANKYIPIKVKYTESPAQKDIRHLLTFKDEYAVEKGYIICRTTVPLQLSDGITALPWQSLLQIFE